MKRISWEVVSADKLILPGSQGVMEFRSFTSGILLVSSQIETRDKVLIDIPQDPQGCHISAQFFLQGSASIMLGNGRFTVWSQDSAAVIRADTPGFQLLVPGGQKLKHICVAMYQHVLKPKLADTLSMGLDHLIFSEETVDIATPVAVSQSLREAGLELYRIHRNSGLDQIRSESLALRLLTEALESYVSDAQPIADQPASGSPEDRQRAAVAVLRKLIEATPQRRVLPAEYPGLFGMSEPALSRAFRAEMHMTIADYRRSVILLRARESLVRSKRSIKEVSFDSGYGHVGNFTRAYLKEFGENPSDTLRRRPT